MAKSTLSRHGYVRVAALSLGGFVIAGCSGVSDPPAPVYVLRITSSAGPEAVAAAPVVREAMEPIVLAPSMQASAAVGHPSSDVIPLDEPPPRPAAEPAKQAAEPARPPAQPATMAAAAPPAPMPMPAPPRTAAPAPTPAVAALPAPAAAPPVVPPVAASAKPEPSAAEQARAEPPPPPVRAPIAAEPPMADIATPGAFVKVKDDRARYRPRYYYSP